MRPSTLDFSSSGRGAFRTHQLASGGVRLVNALELVDWAEEKTQLLVCEACGFTNCEPGGWVSVRRAGSLVLLLPAPEAVFGEKQEREEYSPPPYLRQRGAARFDASVYEGLRSQHASFPPVEKLRRLSLREAALIYQWDAPARVLGEPPRLDAVRRDIVVGASEGDHAAHLERLESLVRRLYQDESAADLRPALGGERVVTLFLDAEEFMEWHALVFDGATYRLLIDSEQVVAGDLAG